MHFQVMDYILSILEAAFVVILLAATTGSHLNLDNPPSWTSDWLRFGTLLSFETAWTILSLLVIRWAGYRMTWHWRLRRFKEPQKANAG
jgi:chromate transport protein ChrA